MKTICSMLPEIWSATDVIFCHFGLFFALLTPNNQKSQNFEKMKKTPGDIIILHLCTRNDNHMMYGSSDIKHNRHNFFFFHFVYFLPFYPVNNPKNQNFEKMKKTWRYHSTQVYQKSRSYAILFLRNGT